MKFTRYIFIILCGLYSGSVSSLTCPEAIQEINAVLDRLQASSNFEPGQWAYFQMAPGLEIPVRVVGNNPDHSVYEVEVSWANGLVQGIDSKRSRDRVPARQLRKTRTGSESVVVEALSCLTNTCYHPAIGETIRFRNTDGTLEEGKVVQLSDKVGLAVPPTSKSTDLVFAAPSAIFAKNGPVESFTPDFPDFPYSGTLGVSFANDSAAVDRTIHIPAMTFPKPAGSARVFLDAAAKMESLPHYHELNHRDRIRALMELYKAFTRISPPAFQMLIESSGGNNVEGILNLGIVCCRQNAIVLGTAYAEAGYHVRLAWRSKGELPPGGEGHIWLEVDAPEDDRIETWVVDRNLTASGQTGVTARFSAFVAIAEGDPTISLRGGNSRDA